MKSTLFSGNQMRIASYDKHHDVVKGIVVPTLGAYAIEYSEFTPPPNHDLGYQMLSQGIDYELDGDNLKFRTHFGLHFGQMDTCRLVVHYHGIRDYTLLFPQIEDARVRDRLSGFFEEAEMAFDSGAWLSFSLMASAVYEGLLGWRLSASKESLRVLIDSAENAGIIDTREAGVLQQARNTRNLVHANRAEEEWVTRARAMDMRTVMNRLCRKLSVEAVPETRG